MACQGRLHTILQQLLYNIEGFDLGHACCSASQDTVNLHNTGSFAVFRWGQNCIVAKMTLLVAFML